MENQNIKTTNGFTLIETIIYMGIIGAVLSSFMGFGTTLSGLRNRAMAMEEVQASTYFTMDLIARKIRQAKSVDAPAKGSASNVLRLVMPDINSTIVTFATNTDGILEMTEGAGDGIAIASRLIEFTDLSFTNLGEGSGKDSVKIEMSSMFKNDDNMIEFDYSENIQATVNTKDKQL